MGGWGEDAGTGGAEGVREGEDEAGGYGGEDGWGVGGVRCVEGVTSGGK